MNIQKLRGGIKGRLSVLVCVVLAIVAAGSWVNYAYQRRAIVFNLEEKLVATASERSDQINAYLKSQTDHAAELARQTEIYNAVATLGSLSNEELKGPAAKKESGKLVLFLEEFSTTESYRNTILITKDGRTFFSDYAPEYVGIRLTDPKYKNSALGESYMRAIMSLTSDVSTFAFDSVLKRIALFITAPIFKENKLLGFIVKEVDTKPIYSIIYNYIGLGRTGDVVIGKKVPEGILYLSNTRDKQVKPFKYFLYFNHLYEVHVDIPLARASTGHDGDGIYTDRTKKLTVAGFQYVPIADWGIVAKIDLHELYEGLYYLYLLSYLLTLLLIISLFVAAYLESWIGMFAKFLGLAHNKKHVWYIKIAVFLIMFGICVVALVIYAFDSRREFDLEKQKSEQMIEDTAVALSYELSEYERIGKEIAYDIFAGRLEKSELVQRMKRDIEENPSLYGITIAYQPNAFSPNRRLYAPYVHRQGDALEVAFLDESIDYTKEKSVTKGKESQSWAWYAQAIANNKLVWLDPYYDPLSKLMLVGYSIPFFDPADKEHTKPLGVINMIFDTKKIQSLVVQVDVETPGYVYLISQSGGFLYHSIPDYVTRQVTIYDLAREQSNGKLIPIAQNALKGKKEFDFYTDFATGEKTITYFEPISITHWAIGIVMAEKSVSLSPLIERQYYMLLLLLFILLLFALLWLLGSLFLSNAQQYATVMTVILCAGLMGLYYIILHTPVFVEEDKVVIADPIKLGQFEFKLDNFAKQVSEEPSVKIPTGIYIYSAAFTNPITIAVSGYIWQKFDKKLGKSWIIDPQLPQAVTDYRLKKIYEVEEGDYTIVGWFFDTSLAQNFDYSKYPLDLLTVRIDLEYADLSKNVTLVPALDDYTEINPEALPGIGDSYGLVFELFQKKRSFFTLSYEIEDTNLGMKTAYSGVTNHVYTSFNLSLMRQLLYDFIVLLLPLLIIFYSLYTIFSIGERDKTFTPLTALSAYTGLVFTAIILHGTFRARLEVNQLLYIEYLFFMFYVTFVLLVIHALIKVYKGRLNHYFTQLYQIFRIFFWPIQLMTFFIITMIVFHTP